MSVKGYDPGKCDQDSHGKLIMIKDRQNKDKLLVCAEENQGYIWKTTDGKYSILIEDLFTTNMNLSTTISKRA